MYKLSIIQSSHKVFIFQCNFSIYRIVFLHSLPAKSISLRKLKYQVFYPSSFCLYLQARQVRSLHRSAARAGAGGIFVVSSSFFSKVKRIVQKKLDTEQTLVISGQFQLFTPQWASSVKLNIVGYNKSAAYAINGPKVWLTGPEYEWFSILLCRFHASSYKGKQWMHWTNRNRNQHWRTTEIFFFKKLKTFRIIMQICLDLHFVLCQIISSLLLFFSDL